MSPKHTQIPLAETHILDEDEFTEKLDGIIERDFFPDLKQLRAENRALEIGADVAKPDVSDTNISASLTEFLDNYTSEDSASFKLLLHIENKNRNERRTKASGPGSGTSNQLAPGTNNGQRKRLQAWKYNPRNALMFMPDGRHAECGTSDKRIVYQNTRMPPPAEIRDDMSVMSEETDYGYSTPLINGYKLLSPESKTILPTGDRPTPKGFTIMPASRGEALGPKMVSRPQSTRAKGGVQRKGGSTPSARAAILSPAAKRLLERSASSPRRIGPPTPDILGDKRLRNRYNSPYNRRIG